MPTAPSAPDWHAMLRRYVGLSAGANLVWEILHFPLYLAWQTASWREIAYDVVHCTAGDVMIATLALAIGLIVLGSSSWPTENFARVAAATIIVGLAYTVFSEWLNVVVRKSWAYAPSMPVAPWLGIGISPLLQWIVVPLVALRWARGSGDTGRRA